MVSAVSEELQGAVLDTTEVVLLQPVKLLELVAGASEVELPSVALEEETLASVVHGTDELSDDILVGSRLVDVVFQNPVSEHEVLVIVPGGAVPVEVELTVVASVLVEEVTF